MKVYGPYTRKDSRKHVVIIHDNGKRQTKSYPRFLLEQHLGRELTKDETVDHINEDCTDDRLENLQILSLSENASKGMLSKKARKLEYVCPCCGSFFTRFVRDVKANNKKGRKGPYCSRVCAGKDTYVNPWKSTPV